MFSLNNFFNGEKDTCKHRFPDITLIGDALDREDREVRVYFCEKCKDYKWKYPESRKLSEEERAEFKRDKYFLYCTDELLTDIGKRRRK